MMNYMSGLIMQIWPATNVFDENNAQTTRQGVIFCERKKFSPNKNMDHENKEVTTGRLTAAVEDALSLDLLLLLLLLIRLASRGAHCARIINN
jgi:hypothetical protein